MDGWMNRRMIDPTTHSPPMEFKFEFDLEAPEETFLPHGLETPPEHPSSPEVQETISGSERSISAPETISFTPAALLTPDWTMLRRDVRLQDGENEDSVRVPLPRPVRGESLEFRKRWFLGEMTELQDVIRSRDVLPAVYEGGFKLWECSLDLLAHLAERQEEKASMEGSADDGSAGQENNASEMKEQVSARGGPLDIKGQRILDLGCGHGLPGVYCVQRGAERVVFQDLNRHVLENVTIHNVLLNLPDGTPPAAFQDDRPLGVEDKVAFVSGDWRAEGMAALLNSAGGGSGDGDPEGDGAFDLVLSADCLYNEEVVPHLFHLLKRVLRKPDGRALVAAKRFYFGVGGGTHTLEEIVNRGGEMTAERVQVFEDGKSNIRDVLELRWK